MFFTLFELQEKQWNLYTFKSNKGEKNYVWGAQRIEKYQHKLLEFTQGEQWTVRLAITLQVCGFCLYYRNLVKCVLLFSSVKDSQSESKPNQFNGCMDSASPPTRHYCLIFCKSVFFCDQFTAALPLSLNPTHFFNKLCGGGRLVHQMPFWMMI